MVAGWHDAEVCAKLFRENSAKIDGILVTLPNFGDERAVADSIKLSGLSVPVYVHAFADKVDEFSIEHRRDSFCGKLSVCNNLDAVRAFPTRSARTTCFRPIRRDSRTSLHWFAGVCRVVRGLHGARIGCLGERTMPFKTVRFSEKLLEQSGISVEVEEHGGYGRRGQRPGRFRRKGEAKLEKLGKYLPANKDVPPQAMMTTAKLGVVLDKWVDEEQINAYAIQCWSAMQNALKIFPCSIMSMMSNELLPAACEVDVMGAMAMYAMQLGRRRRLRRCSIGTTTTAKIPTSSWSSIAATRPPRS